MSNSPVFLIAFANDREDEAEYLRNLAEEKRLIQAALDRPEALGLCECKYLSNTTLEEILNAFEKYRNRIALFHYGGHADSFDLLLETREGSVELADMRGLAAFLGQQNGLELVFLNGCSTQPQVESLLENNVSLVIATSQAIDDEVAMTFAGRFYSGLASGASIDNSYKQAKAAIRAASGTDVHRLYSQSTRREPASLREERWPWALYIKKGAEESAQWNLPEATGNPLFGLPDVPRLDLPADPFRYLSLFSREHAEIFFGRDQQIRQLYDRVTGLDAAPIILLYGQSGVGKSSILDAGLRPRLESSHEILYMRRNQELGLPRMLKQSLGLSAGSKDELGAAWRAHEERVGRPLLLIIDQLEEVFARPNPELPGELSVFLSCLEAIFLRPEAPPKGKLILGFRKEWESELEQSLKERKLAHAKIFLERLGRKGIIQAISSVARVPRLQQQYGLTIEAGLPEIVADDLLDDPNSPIAPTLQILLTKMWTEAKKRNSSQPVFNNELYGALKREGILLGDFLDQQLSALQAAQPDAVNSGLVLDVLAYHTTPLGTAEQRTLSETEQQYRHIPDRLKPLLGKLKELYLLADPPQDRQDPVVVSATRLAHDTLAPPIRFRLDRSVQPGQRARRILENRSPEWREQQQGTPLDERDLAAVERGTTGMRCLTSDEERLLRASRDARALRARRGKILRVIGALAVVAIIVFAAVAFWQRRQAKQAEQQALSRQLLAQANLLRTNPRSLSFIQSVLLDVEAQRRFPSMESNSELITALGLLPVQVAQSNLGGGDVSALRFSPDGKYLAVIQGKEVQVRDLGAGQNEQIKARFTNEWTCYDAAFSSDGKYLAIGCGETEGETTSGQSTSQMGTAVAWDWQRKEQVAKLNLRSAVEHVSFIESTHQMVATDNLVAVVVDVEKRRDKEIRRIELNKDEYERPYEIAISQDSRFIASGFRQANENSHDSVFDLTSGKQIYTYPAINGWDTTSAIAISGDGKMLAVGHGFVADAVRGDSLSIVNLTTRKAALVDITGNITDLVFSPNGKYLAVLDGTQGILRILDSRGNDVVASIDNSTQSSSPKAGLFFSPDSQHVIIYNSDTAARFFRIPFSFETEKRPPAQEVLRMATESPIGVAALSRDGQYFVAVSEGGLLTAWKTTTVLEHARMINAFRGQNFMVDENHPEGIAGAEEGSSFSPKGRYIILGSEITHILDANDGHELIQPDKELEGHVFSRNDDYLALSYERRGTVIRELATNREFQLKPDEKEVADIVPSSRRPSLFILSSEGVAYESEYAKPATLRELDLNSGKSQLVMELPAAGLKRMSPDAQYLAILTGKVLEIIAIDSGKRLRFDVGDRGTCNSVTFSETGKYVFTCGGQRTMKLWESATGRLVTSVPLPKDDSYDQPRKAAFDPADNLLAFEFANQIQVVNLQTKRSVTLASDAVGLSIAAFSSDSEHLITMDSSNTARLWRVPEGLPEGAINGSSDITESRFSADGKYIVLLENDLYRLYNSEVQLGLLKSIQARSIIWKPDDLRENICRWLPRNLTQEEWGKFLGGEAYSKTCPNLP